MQSWRTGAVSTYHRKETFSPLTLHSCLFQKAHKSEILVRWSFLFRSVGRVGADEDIESPELTTSRPFLKIPFTSAAPKVETTTLKIQNKMPAQTKSPEEIDKEKVHLSDSERKMDPAEEGTNVFTEKHSDNLFKRTEVLAAVIAGGVIGFLFAIFLILLLVYRMRKKDEGSYDLGERKPSSAAYQKAPTKEFYA
uniref:Syndecan n=1 Tax=Oryctolagus cuniculus TaxID=9986 RepID=A0A5F9C345_RABIT